MVTQVSFGSLSTIAGKNVFTGSASGFDTEALVESLVAAKSIQATGIEDKISGNTNKLSAFSEFKTLLDSFRSSVNSLRNPPGIAQEASNTFKYRSATITSNTATAGETFVDVTASPGATSGVRTITIGTLAKARTQVTSSSFASRTDPIVGALGNADPNTISAGSLTITNLAGKSGVVDIEENDSLNDVVFKINAKKDETGLEADVIKVADNDYRLVLKSTLEGTDNAYSISDPDGALSELAYDPVASYAADNAVFTINGISLTRQSNTVTDAIDKVTLKLKELTAGATVTVNIGNDTETVLNSITSFVNSYNELKVFAAKQTAVDADGNAAEDAYLVGNATLRSIMGQIENEVTSLVGGIDDADLKSLQEIGITFTDYPGDEESPEIKNILTFDSSKMSGFLASDFDEVRKIFEFNYTADSTDFAITKRTNAVSINEFTINIDTVTDTYEAVYTPAGGGGPVTIELDYEEFTGGVTLRGKAGTVLEGLEMVYANTGTASVDVTLTQGIADRLYNVADGAIDDDGLLTVETTSLGESSTDLEEELAKVNGSIEKFKLQLLEKFASLERAISQVNTLLQTLDAQGRANDNA